ncbi:MAG: hypothetical protein ACKOBM_13840 [Gammaproteobacteria bacterium]
MDIRDERMHPVGDAPAWSESYYFNFVDPTNQIAMFTRMGFRPGDGWADGLHAVYLGGDRVAFTYGRRDIGRDLSVYDGALTVGGLTLTCLEPFGRWRVSYDGPAQDIADAAILLERRKARPADWFTPSNLRMDIDFTALAKPHYAADGARGHFEQTGRAEGTIALTGSRGPEAFRVDGFGVRDKSWGPRDWGAGSGSGASRPAGQSVGRSVGQSAAGSANPGAGPKPFVNWFSMNFGADLALGGACVRHADGVMRGSGWLQRDGTTIDLVDVVIETRYRPGSIWHTDVHLTGRTTEGAPVDVTGRILTVCPTKIPMPGGATFVNEGLAEFHTEGRVGYGISEHWHAVAKDAD